MTKIIQPGVVIAGAAFKWELLDMPLAMTWAMQVFQNGVDIPALSATGVASSTGDVARIAAGLPAGTYEIQYAFGSGEERILPLQSIANLEFIWAPDYGVKVARKPAIRTIQFGDGYKQEMSVGINQNPEEWDVSFSELNETEAMQIDLFLQDRKGVEPFRWRTPVGRVLIFTAPEHSRVMQDDDSETVSSRFVQTFL